MLRVALVNLLSNAVKFTRRRELAEIEIGCSNGNQDEVVFYVKDNGVGFDMKYVNKLFPRVPASPPRRRLRRYRYRTGYRPAHHPASRRQNLG